MTEMFGEAWSPMSVPDLAPDDDDDVWVSFLAIIFMSFQQFAAWRCNSNYLTSQFSPIWTVIQPKRSARLADRMVRRG